MLVSPKLEPSEKTTISLAISFNRNRDGMKKEQQCIHGSLIALIQVSQDGISEHKGAEIHFKQW